MRNRKDGEVTTLGNVDLKLKDLEVEEDGCKDGRVDKID